jgi:hypothetical protein
VINALGQRVQKAAGGAVTRFHYNEANQLLYESTGTTTRDYVWLGDLPVGVVDRNGTTASVTFIHADGLGHAHAAELASPQVVRGFTEAVLAT